MTQSADDRSSPPSRAKDKDAKRTASPDRELTSAELDDVAGGKLAEPPPSHHSGKE